LHEAWHLKSSRGIVMDRLDYPKRCYYNNDGQADRDVYGQLYNFFAVKTGKLCPAGWHVPSRDEWGTLIG
jgi:uncharacterized protein (TIGR02145 family)